MSKMCDFCEVYKKYKNWEEAAGLTPVYKVGLFRDSKVGEIWRSRANYDMHGGYELNFCPECGADLRGEKNV